MLSENVKHRLSIAFESTKDAIYICQDIVIKSSLPSTWESQILADLEDVENILKQQKFEDVDAIEEAIVALDEVYISAKNLLPDGERLKESLDHILQWLKYIKKMLGYEGLVPTSMEDIRSGSHTTIQRTSHSNYGYLDDSGSFTSVEYMER